MLRSKKSAVNAIKVFADNWGIPLDQVTAGGGTALIIMGLRESTTDLNVWVDSPHFERLAEHMNTQLHPLRDDVIKMVNVSTYIRKRNPYFKHVTTEEDVQIFDSLPLMIQKRGGYADHLRPLVKREQDLKDIRALVALQVEQNKVLP